MRIRTGRRIGSAALVADGLHARIDGLTSLAVLVGAIGIWLGFPLADPHIVRDAARTMWGSARGCRGPGISGGDG